MIASFISGRTFPAQSTDTEVSGEGIVSLSRVEDTEVRPSSREQEAQPIAEDAADVEAPAAVSYTHLTLPTKRIV